MRGFSCKTHVLSIYWKNPEGSGPRVLRVLSLPEKGAALHGSSPRPAGRCERPAWKRPRAGAEAAQGSAPRARENLAGRCVHAPRPPALPPGRYWQGAFRMTRTPTPRARRVREGSSGRGRGSPRGGDAGSWRGWHLAPRRLPGARLREMAQVSGFSPHRRTELFGELSRNHPDYGEES